MENNDVINVQMNKDYYNSLMGEEIYEDGEREVINVTMTKEFYESLMQGGGDTPIEKPIGVYIYTTDGEFITSDAWDSANNDKVFGIFVNDGNHDFVIAKGSVYGGKRYFGGYEKLLKSIPAISSIDDARLDFDGVNNTSKIIAELSGYNDGYTDGAPAAEACANYTFPDGTKGYLPALGELILAHANRAEVDAALIACDGLEFFKNITYWVSTQVDFIRCWGLMWREEHSDMGYYIDYSHKGNTNYVRPFCKI